MLQMSMSKLSLKVLLGVFALMFSASVGLADLRDVYDDYAGLPGVHGEDHATEKVLSCVYQRKRSTCIAC